MGIRVSREQPSAANGGIGRNETVDYGPLFPQGIYPAADHDWKAIRRFIRDGRLAPFYKGMDSAPSLSKPVSKAPLSWLPTIRRAPSKDQLLYKRSVECPICFLTYPAFINYSRCCDKPICTDCFLQLKRSFSAPLVPVVCPFCVQPNFGVVHIPPEWSPLHATISMQRPDLVSDNGETCEKRRGRLGPNDKSVILVDEVRPNWHNMLQVRPDVRRRYSSGLSGSGTTRRVIVRPNQHETTRGQTRRSTSVYGAIPTTDYSDYSSRMQGMDLDLEDVMVMEAIRLSLAGQPQTNTNTDS